MRRLNGHQLNVGLNMLLVLDVDLTLLPSTSLDVQEWQRGLLRDLFVKTAGGLAFVTGRSMISMEKCFPGMPTISVEHHAAHRVPDANSADLGRHVLNEHVKKPDTTRMAADMARALKCRFPVYTPEDNTRARGVIVEPKEYSLALVHNNTIDASEIDYVTDITKDVWRAYGLESSHEVKVGFDAVEVSVAGRDKGVAMRDIMAHPFYQGRIPVFVGDSMADAKGMDVAFHEFNGHGIAVGDKGIPDAPYVHYRADGISDVWNFLSSLNQHPALNPVLPLNDGPTIYWKNPDVATDARQQPLCASALRL